MANDQVTPDRLSRAREKAEQVLPCTCRIRTPTAAEAETIRHAPHCRARYREEIMEALFMFAEEEVRRKS
jgi:hypothetical protein